MKYFIVVLTLILANISYGKALGYYYYNLDTRLIAGKHCILVGTYNQPGIYTGTRKAFLTNDVICKNPVFRQTLLKLNNEKAAVFISSDFPGQQVEFEVSRLIYDKAGIKEIENKAAEKLLRDLSPEYRITR